MTAALIFFGGGLGALGRYAFGGFVQARAASLRPWGTAAVNLTGTFLAGLLAGYLNRHGHLATDLSPVTIGFLGGYTTFSTWMVETLLMGSEGGDVGRSAAAVNLIGPTIGGLAVAAVGYAVGSLV